MVVVEVEGGEVGVEVVEAVQEKVVAVESGFECSSRISGWKSGIGSSRISSQKVVVVVAVVMRKAVLGGSSNGGTL